MRIVTKEYNLETNKKINNIKIALIADIHYASVYNDNRLFKIYEEIKTNNVDYICIPGDLIDDLSELNNQTIKNILEWLKKLSSLAPTIISLGNHDVRDKMKKYAFNSNWYNKINNIKNVYLLDNNNITINNINFIGFTSNYKYFEDMEKDYNLVKNDLKNICSLSVKSKYNVLLSHSPSYLFKENIFNNTDLIVCGHTHGGLCPSFIPGTFGLISPTKYLFPKKVRGYLKNYNTDIIITSGIVKLSRSTKFLYKLTDIFAMEVTIININ